MILPNSFLSALLPFNPLLAVLFQRNLASIKKTKKIKNLSLAGFKHGTLDCEFNALPTWPLQHTEVNCNI